MASQKFTAVAQEVVSQSSQVGFVVDVSIYDNELPDTLKFKHCDTTHKYVAFVTFGENYCRCTVSWNVKAKNSLDVDSEYDYIDQHKDAIIDSAIEIFKNKFPDYQPEKSWK